MAEGIEYEIPNLGSKYFCHQCSKEVSPQHTREMELNCPRCSSGFLEEVSRRELFELEIPESYDFETYFGGVADDVDDDDAIEDILAHRSLLRQLFEDDLQLPGSERNASEIGRDRLNEENSFIDSILPVSADYITDREAHLLRMRFFEDYGVGSDSEVDAIASQLLDEVNIDGPPPLSKDQMKALPLITLEEAHIAGELQCTVCMNDYKVGEKAKQLTCEHLFHEKCIAPWLERQASCPNCRRAVKVEGKNKRSLSCPRTLSMRPRSSNSSNRRFSEVSSLGDFFTASMNMNPFRFL